MYCPVRFQDTGPGNREVPEQDAPKFKRLYLCLLYIGVKPAILVSHAHMPSYFEAYNADF